VGEIYSEHLWKVEGGVRLRIEILRWETSKARVVTRRKPSIFLEGGMEGMRKVNRWRCRNGPTPDHSRKKSAGLWARNNLGQPIL